jgi:hypothetical protein
MLMRILIACLALASLCPAPGRCGDLFPTVSAENLLGAKAELPGLVKGRTAVLAIGFTHASQSETKAWSQRIGRDLDAYSVAVLQDVPRLLRGMVKGGIKDGVPQAQRDRFLLLFTGEKDVKQAAGFDRADDAYLVLLDRDGAVRWRFHGPVTDASLADLKSRAAALEAVR